MPELLTKFNARSAEIFGQQGDDAKAGGALGDAQIEPSLRAAARPPAASFRASSVASRLSTPGTARSEQRAAVPREPFGKCMRLRLFFFQRVRVTKTDKVQRGLFRVPLQILAAFGDSQDLVLLQFGAART